MTHLISTLFDTLPCDLQDKVCEKIVYPQSHELLEEIRSTRLSNFYRDMIILIGITPKKKVGFSLKETQICLRKASNLENEGNRLADTLGHISEDILRKSE
jgi:hypothetical protein